MGFWCHYEAAFRMPVGQELPDDLWRYVGKNLRPMPDCRDKYFNEMLEVWQGELETACSNPDEWMPFSCDGGSEMHAVLGLLVCSANLEDGKAEKVLEWFRKAVKIPGLEAAEMCAADDFDIIKAYYDGCCLSVKHDNPWKE